MTRGINKVILIGRLGSNPDLRYTPNGSAVAKFNVATTERVPTADGNWEDRTEWHRVVVFGKLAETCGSYLTKGRLVYIEGKLRTQQWEDSQGVKRFTTEVVAREVQFLDTARDVTKPEAISTMPEDLPADISSDEDDIPF